MRGKTAIGFLGYRLVARAIERLRQTWFRPRSEILVFDELTLEILGELLDNYKLDVLHVRRKRIKLHIACLAIFEQNFWRNRKMCAYFDAYIRWSRCKIVLTASDNNSYFLSISERIGGKKTIFIQASRRSEHGDLFECLKTTSDRYKVDRMIVHSKSIGKEYSRYIRGEVIALGSIRNNVIRLDDPTSNGKLIVVSQWRKCANKGRYRKLYCGGYITFDEFYRHEKIFFKTLSEWAQGKGRKIYILSAQREDGEYALQERDYYGNILGNASWELVVKGSSDAAYEYVQGAELCVTMDSTMGYEMLARGNKVVLFHCRFNEYNWKDYRYGWPDEDKVPMESKTFCVSNVSESSLKKCLDNVSQMDEQEWASIASVCSPYVMSYDPGNIGLKKTLKELVADAR